MVSRQPLLHIFWCIAGDSHLKHFKGQVTLAKSGSFLSPEVTVTSALEMWVITKHFALTGENRSAILKGIVPILPQEEPNSMSVTAELKEIFEKMPAAFLPEKAANINATIQLELTGEDGGDWALNIANGAIGISPGRAAAPNLTLTMAAEDYVALSRGEANPINLFMAGKIKPQGDMTLAMKFQDMFDRNKA
jgi:putative sterol carrier protein